ncbi:MAG: nitrate reductase associated protein [Cyanophyceae cyanobacterium]
MSPFFEFERDFVDSLRCIPMQVRYNLDRCGVKLKLHHWHHLNEEERRLLVALPCDSEADRTTYRKTLHDMVLLRSGERPKDLPVEPVYPWQREELPSETVDQATQVNVALSGEQWRSLSEIQRFVLVKLSRPGHENRNFIPALKEFGLSS